MDTELDPTGTEGEPGSVTLAEPAFDDIDAIVAAHFGGQQQPPAPTQTPAPTPAPAVQAAAPPTPVAPVEPPPQAQPQGLPPELIRLMTSLQEKERLLDQRLAEAQAVRQKYEPLARFEPIEQRLHEQDAEGALKALGVDLESLNKAVLEGRGVNPNRQLEQRFVQTIQELQKRYDEKFQAVEEGVRARQEAEAMAEIRREVTARSPLLTSMGEEKASGLIMTALRAHYDRTGEVLSYDQVVPQVESQYRKLLEAALANESVRKQLNVQVATGDVQRVPPAQTKTLTNRQAATVTKRTNPNELPADREKAIEAILAG